jgi:hypothetical protein
MAQIFDENDIKLYFAKQKNFIYILKKKKEIICFTPAFSSKYLFMQEIRKY